MGPNILHRIFLSKTDSLWIVVDFQYAEGKMRTVSFKQIQHSCLKPVLSRNSTLTLRETNCLKQVLSCNYTFTLHANKCLKIVCSVCNCTAFYLNAHDICRCYQETVCRKDQLKWDLWSSGMLHSIKKSFDFLTLEDGTDRLSWKVGKE